MTEWWCNDDGEDDDADDDGGGDGGGDNDDGDDDMLNYLRFIAYCKLSASAQDGNLNFMYRDLNDKIDLAFLISKGRLFYSFGPA